MVMDPGKPVQTTRTEPPPIVRGRMPVDADVRSAGDLAHQLSEQASRLIRQEMQLARLEMTEKISKMGRNAVYIAIGAALGYAGLLALVQAAINGLGTGIWRYENSWLWLAVWLAPLVIGLVVAGIGYAFIQKGLSALKKESIVPEKTLDTMRENKQWLEKQIK